MNCSDGLYVSLMDNLMPNQTEWNNWIRSHTMCHMQNSSADQGGIVIFDFGRDFYGFATPFIALVGLIGNAISLKVFTSRVMRRLSSSYYLAMLSASDMLVLLSYVFIDWLDKGLPRWPGGHRIPAVNSEGMCHIFLFLSYATRFSSVWLIIAFTGERYIAICHQRYRKKICSKKYARKITVGVCIISCLLCLYKPFLSGSFETDQHWSEDTHVLGRVCVRNPKFASLNFVLDSLYALLLTAVPALIIIALSMPILRRLVTSRKRQKDSRLVFRENRIRLEFTIIFLAISSCFVFLNIPYLVTWCQQFWGSMEPHLHTNINTMRLSGHIFITRTIFYLNYCIKFFLYCLTGAYYRREIRSLLKFSTRFHNKRNPNSVILHGWSL